MVLRRMVWPPCRRPPCAAGTRTTFEAAGSSAGGRAVNAGKRLRAAGGPRERPGEACAASRGGRDRPGASRDGRRPSAPAEPPRARRAPGRGLPRASARRVRRPAGRPPRPARHPRRPELPRSGSATIPPCAARSATRRRAGGSHRARLRRVGRADQPQRRVSRAGDPGAERQRRPVVPPPPKGTITGPGASGRPRRTSSATSQGACSSTAMASPSSGAGPASTSSRSTFSWPASRRCPRPGSARRRPPSAGDSRGESRSRCARERPWRARARRREPRRRRSARVRAARRPRAARRAQEGVEAGESPPARAAANARARRGRCGRRAGAGLARQLERRVLAQDRLLELPQRLARLDPELLRSTRRAAR